MMFKPLVWFVAKQQSNDAAGESQDAGLRGQLFMRRVMFDGGIHEKEPRERSQQELRTELLFDAEHALGMQLAEREAIALDQLVELLDLPSEV
ncbi:MAG: hypothetical protein AAB263_08050, partial [Planctomycetota bacterium]